MKNDIAIKVAFTDGWEERISKAAYDLYKRMEQRKDVNHELFSNNSDQNGLTGGLKDDRNNC